MALLSILIATMPKRKSMFERILHELKGQCNGHAVEFITDDGIGSIGAKRQRMLEAAQGQYIAFVDDDDWVSPDYINSIIEGLLEYPDVIGFRGHITTDGKRMKLFKISKDCEYTETKREYHRYNNHLSPVKRELALQTGFKDMSYGEDFDYATRLRPLIQTEVFIDKQLYFYKYVTRKP